MVKRRGFAVVCTRPVLERFQRIAAALQVGPCSARRLGRDLEVSQKTIERDIEFMRDRLGIPIVGTGQGYVFAEPVVLCRVCGGRHS